MIIDHFQNWIPYFFKPKNERIKYHEILQYYSRKLGLKKDKPATTAASSAKPGGVGAAGSAGAKEGAPAQYAPRAVSENKLAKETGCPADLMSDSAKMNTWLHKSVLKKIAENGGNLPQSLLD